MSAPRTRLRAKKQSPAGEVIDLTGEDPPVQQAPEKSRQPPTTSIIQNLPSNLTSTLTNLSPPDHALLLRKQAHLQRYAIDVPRDFRKYQASVQATLVFAQEEAGTAVCVSRGGLLLTCAHCVSDNNDDDDEERPPDPEQLYWLLFASGRVVAARCVGWDGRRDLALLRVVAAQAQLDDARTPDDAQARFLFAEVQAAAAGPSPGDKLICVGHPGSEDLEADEPGRKTGYDVLHLSTGTFRGYAVGQDRQDNSEIGALQHDCWTYWGHSGAPLFDRRSGKLVGLHSSWDEETAMRRGVGLEAVVAFLEENL
ncbi:trypsin-like cysteine/serine peptidase domain-containing protein [Coniochaeta sp. 2T2.1]|nr:trypsin-like cysteine/serine peptidase domain-containing protein [Coniochaeta sp. 2T2.1]